MSESFIEVFFFNVRSVIFKICKLCRQAAASNQSQLNQIKHAVLYYEYMNRALVKINQWSHILRCGICINLLDCQTSEIFIALREVYHDIAVSFFKIFLKIRDARQQPYFSI